MPDACDNDETSERAFPGQVVLVLQGGGALGAFQVGVYEALEEAGITPDWVIGTSIGALNAAIIAGNARQQRRDRLDEFWRGMTRQGLAEAFAWWPSMSRAWSRIEALTLGVPGLFSPAAMGQGPFAASLHAPLGPEKAAFYSTEPLRDRIASLIDVTLLNAGAPRLTVGAVNLRSGRMRYFDTAREPLGIEHLLASSALPPAFPAVAIDGELYWDGGAYSNTPVEAVFADSSRRSAVIFAVQLWNADGREPQSIWDAMGRQKDILYASRAEHHLAWQTELHHLRHIVRELGKHIPAKLAASQEVRELTRWGCATSMHLVRLVAPVLEGDDLMKDVDFGATRVAERRAAGYAAAQRMIARAPWRSEIDPRVGVAIHDDDQGNGEAESESFPS